MFVCLFVCLLFLWGRDVQTQNQELANQSPHKNPSASDVSNSLNVFFVCLFCLFVCLFVCLSVCLYVCWVVCLFVFVCFVLFLFFSNGVVAEAGPKRYFYMNNNKIAAIATRMERCEVTSREQLEASGLVGASTSMDRLWRRPSAELQDILLNDFHTFLLVLVPRIWSYTKAVTLS